MSENKKIGKRAFLKKLSVISGGVFAGFGINKNKQELISMVNTVEKVQSDSLEMPMIQFGKHKITKLIAGGNQMAWKLKLGESSYNYYDKYDKDYLPFEDALTILRMCESNGINIWTARGDSHIIHMLFNYRERGGKLNWLGQTASEQADPSRNIKEIAANGAIATYLHGNQTGRYFQEGKQDTARDLLKVIRDTGMLVGMASHTPEPFYYAEEKGWDLDFYYAALQADDNREKQLKFIKQTDKICLAYKILQAGRRCKTPESTKEAFEYTLKNIKKKDAIVVGMFLPYHVVDNIRYTKTVWQDINLT
jgi:hypothetical protein